MKKASFSKNHRDFENSIDWYGNFLDRQIPVMSQIDLYELLETFVLRIAARWEVLVVEDLITSLNRDSSKYSAEIGLNIGKHLTKDQSEAILIGHRYIDFHQTSPRPRNVHCRKSSCSFSAEHRKSRFRGKD